MRRAPAPAEASRIAGIATIGMVASTIHADDYAGMLNTVIRVEQKRPNDTRVRLKCVPHHFREPLRLDDLDIVVQ